MKLIRSSIVFSILLFVLLSIILVRYGRYIYRQYSSVVVTHSFVAFLIHTYVYWEYYSYIPIFFVFIFRNILEMHGKNLIKNIIINSLASTRSFVKESDALHNTIKSCLSCSEYLSSRNLMRLLKFIKALEISTKWDLIIL